MYIKEVTLNNFRIYKGENNLSFSYDEKKNITIISGDNGYGKTTFLMALVWCLYGRQMENVDELYKKEINDKSGYPKYVSESLNRLAKKEKEKKFFVSMVFSDTEIGNNFCEVKITRSYHIKDNDENLEILIDNKESEELVDEEDKEGFIRSSILPIEIAKFFLFDAEKIVALAESKLDEERKKLSEAYTEILGIKKYENLKNNLEKILNDYSNESATTEERKELNQLQTNKENLEIDIKENKEKIKNIEEKILQNKNDINDIEQKLTDNKIIKKEELEELKNKQKQLEEKKKEIKDKLKESFNLIPFFLSGNILNKILKQNEKEKRYSSQAGERESITKKINNIKQDIDTKKQSLDFDLEVKTRKFYEEQIELSIPKYFLSGNELTDEVKTIHDFANTQTEKLEELINQSKSDFKDFKKMYEEYEENKDNIMEINKKIKEAEIKSEDEHTKHLRKQREYLENEKEEKAKEIGRLHENIIKKEENEKIIVTKKINALREKISISDDIKPKAKKIKEIQKKINDFMTRFKKAKENSLADKILNNLNQLYHKKNWIKKVDVNIIKGDVTIQLSNDSIMDKSTLSMGERQLYASALLKALIEESNIDFPVFIDSPMQKLDKKHAKNVIEKFYPNISKQVIVLPLLEKELNKEEYEQLLPKIKNTYFIKNTSVDSSEFSPIESKNFFSFYKNL